MTLDVVRKGSTVKILRIDDEDLKSYLIRMGIAEGSALCCVEKIPFGPIILRNKMQEIAIGRGVAKGIEVE